MEQEIREKIACGAAAALVDRTIAYDGAYVPHIIDNGPDGPPLCEVLGGGMRTCSSFDFSVAFISQSGLESIIQPLAEAFARGVRGRILTTDYLTFSEPEALERLMAMEPMVEVRVMTGEAFHTKGYRFVGEDETRTMIVGSSNLTQGALKSNREWNVMIVTTGEGRYADDFSSAFERLWGRAERLSDRWLEGYRRTYERHHEAMRLARKAQAEDTPGTIEPNAMQRMATAALQRLRREGHDKALIIAATGTGKTFLSCFDVKAYRPKRLLFLVHRGQILESAAESFVQVLGERIRPEIGFLSDGRRQFDRKYVFATINTLSMVVADRFVEPDHFDYVIIDEVHRAGAPTYRRILNYLKPDFLLGMSATPDRTDEVNIYSMFDYSIACDIRLKAALENDLLCPFHYFGIADISVDGRPLGEDEDFRNLVSQERVRNIVEKSRFYGWSGSRVMGLVFCSRNEEAARLSELMNAKGLRTVAISGATPMERRLEYSRRLQQEEVDGSQLDYILSVDVLNEGVDLPRVNQIIMLRPTQSSIIFIQQLGRGLRKSEGKEFVVVLDFIANYSRNYLIPAALSGDSSYDKDNLRRDALECSRLVPGASTVDFDPVARSLIYRKIDEADFSATAFLKDQYLQLRYKLGRIPTIRDFREDENVDIQRYVDGFGSYYAFLKKYEKDFTYRTGETGERILAYISRCFSAGKREDELAILSSLLGQGGPRTAMSVSSAPVPFMSDSVRASFTLSFLKTSDREGRYRGCELMDGQGRWSAGFLSLLRDGMFRSLLADIVEDGLWRSRTRYAHRYADTAFVLFEKYTYEDVCRLLGWQRSENAQNIGGYRYDSRTHTLPVFINYVKSEGAIRYEDRFLSPSHLVALSKKPRGVDGPDADHIYRRRPEDRDNRIFLFVRKDKEADERKDFYFLGEMDAEGSPKPVSVDGKKAFEVDYVLRTPVRRDIYDYLISRI